DQFGYPGVRVAQREGDARRGDQGPRERVRLGRDAAQPADELVVRGLVGLWLSASGRLPVPRPVHGSPPPRPARLRNWLRHRCLVGPILPTFMSRMTATSA